VAQLHEFLAVEGDLKGEKDKIRNETLITLTKKQEHFLGYIRRLEMFDDARGQEETEERRALVTTVMDKLKYSSEASIRFWDLRLQKELANQQAKADIVVDGVEMAKGVPVTFLLTMEEELKQLRKVYDAIPTLQPGVSWVKDETLGEGVYKSEYSVKKNKTEKTIEHKILVPTTKEHPAQVREWSEDKPIGRYVQENWSGMFSPAEKSAVLGRIDKVLRAVKRSRQRANTQEVLKASVGRQIFNFIHGS
jgi:hypothetical protein